MSQSFTLWGFHPAYVGMDGYPYPIRLAVGSARDCNGERKRREREDVSRRTAIAGGHAATPGEWTFATYRTGSAPLGIRALCDERYPLRSRLGEGEA